MAQSTNKDLIYLSATEALQLFKEKKLSPVDVLKAQIERIEALNGKVNCITYKHFDSALEQARESESRYVKGNPRPLEGITTAIKDENEVEGCCNGEEVWLQIGRWANAN